LPKIDFRQPLQTPPIPLWAAIWHLSRVSLYRLLPLKGALMLCKVSRHIEMQTHPARRRKLEALLKPLLPDGTSRRDLRRQTVLSKVVSRLGAHTYAVVFRRSRRWLIRTLRPEGLETLEQIKRDGQGAIILANHVGMNAWVGPVLIQLGYPMRLIQRRLVSRHELLLLRSDGWDSQVLPFPRDGDEGIHLKWLYDLVRQGEWIQHASDTPHPTGVEGRYLGHPVRCCRAPWAIARQTGVPLVPVLLLVDERCNPRLIIGSPIHVQADGPPGDAIACAFQSYLDFLDRHLRRALWNLHLARWETLIAGAPPG
jgi:lauroyl/myristoyl acyltransferase